MAVSARVQALVADDGWRYPIAAGLFALLLTVWDAWPSVYELDPPVFLAAALAAYLYYDRGDLDPERIGRRAAIVASFPMLVEIGDVAVYQALRDTSPLWFRFGATGVFVLVYAVFWWVVAVVLAGTLGAKTGAWLAANTDLPRPCVGTPAVLARKQG